jgi:ABC-2 type transport system ATP-binding protein
MEQFMEAVIQVDNLQRTFGEQHAVDGITFEVEPGEVFGLLGPNGAGKTTSVRLLNGILPPSGGSARIFGLDPSQQGEAVRRRTGVLTETPSLYERMSARDNLLFFGTLGEVEEAALESRVLELLALFELESRADDKVEAYSKGMKQRLALARALIHEPPLLFLDEPTAALDPEAAAQVNELIVSLSHTGRTIVLATHNLTEAQRLCDRVGIMNHGRFLAIGSPEELARHLWPATWVDVTLWKADPGQFLDLAKGFAGTKQAEAGAALLSVQLESEEAIPELIRFLAAKGTPIRRVSPREHSLEEIYFTIQNGEAA